MAPKLHLYDGLAAHTYAVRLFILERGGFDITVQSIDIFTLENRKPPYTTLVNPRGEVPALRITSISGDSDKSDGMDSPKNEFILTEVPAIYEYLDEIALGGSSLFGETALERAETRMWLRRMDLEIAQPVISWYRNNPDTVDFYRGYRLVCPEARLSQKIAVNQALNLLDEQLEGHDWLCGTRFSAADVHFYGLLKLMLHDAPWVLLPARRNVTAYIQRMDEREASRTALTLFGPELCVAEKQVKPEVDGKYEDKAVAKTKFVG